MPNPLVRILLICGYPIVMSAKKTHPCVWGCISVGNVDSNKENARGPLEGKGKGGPRAFSLFKPKFYIILRQISIILAFFLSQLLKESLLFPTSSRGEGRVVLDVTSWGRRKSTSPMLNTFNIAVENMTTTHPSII